MSERLRPLDGVRGFAILAVMANHTGISGAQGGYLGVDIFFVLSGYLITTLLLAERTRVGRFSFGRFYMRRLLRLYPALLVACLVAVVAVRHVGFNSEGQAVRAAFTSAAYLQDGAPHWGWDVGFPGLFHTWTLSIEEQFYLVWPAVLALALLAKRWWVVVAVLVVGIAYTATLLVVLRDANLGAYRPDTRGGALLGGCLLAVVLHRRVVVFGAWLGWAALGVLAVTLAAAPTTGHLSAVVVAIPVTWLASAALIADIVTSERLIGRVLGWRPLAYVGLISYGLYLYHPLIYTWVSRDFAVQRRVGAPIAIALSFAAAIVSYRLIEMRFLRLKHRFTGSGSLRAGRVVEQPSDDAGEGVPLAGDPHRLIP